MAFHDGLHPSILISLWFFFSTTLIFSNRYILVELNFPFPLLLTTWHLSLATIATRVLRKYTNLLPGIDEIDKKLTWDKWARTVLPIGLLFSGSLACGNYAYVYLSVSFIQMLKSATPVAVLMVSWFFGTEKFDPKIFVNVLFITFGIAIASFGEITFVMTGFILQSMALLFESTRLVLIQKLLSGRDIKMEALVGLYYFAPVCAGINMFTTYLLESDRITMAAAQNVGLSVILFNGATSFLLNVSAVLVIKKTSTLVLALCGLLKDIGIVVLATLVYSTPIGTLQGFGYSLALLGLIRYKTRTEAFWNHPVKSTLLGVKRVLGLLSNKGGEFSSSQKGGYKPANVMASRDDDKEYALPTMASHSPVRP
ncbi:Cas4p protein [Fimicolochytrium jonesii]|uniref:Cas4p protein n=1 Tax=Fimicolochytrium jonesii TaxID=1396493 RepID=UPI0022FDFED8|nr:Cas4p protein [Fimicolochytrium jonesii]KAI8826192.1 Cas4p protein [Fimicolochytrium jonesii]